MKSVLILTLMQGQKVLLPNIPGATFILTEPIYFTSLMADSILSPMEYPLKVNNGQSYFEPLKAGDFCIVIESDTPVAQSQIVIQ